ncbi:MAG: hypothetical protein V9E96_09775 [Chitinophagaceae bacterium]|jgi:hypothetical protein
MRSILIFVLIIFFCFNNSYSQNNNNATKSETESWILEKLKLNTPMRYFESKYYGTTSKNGSNYSGFKYSFGEYYLNINFEEESTEEYEYFEDGIYKQAKMIKKHLISIPIYDIASVFEYNGYLGIHTNKETINNLIIPSHEKLFTTMPSISDFVNSTFTVKFNFSQTDLAKRLQKAFLHLKKFYKKPQSKELF